MKSNTKHDSTNETIFMVFDAFSDFINPQSQNIPTAEKIKISPVKTTINKKTSINTAYGHASGCRIISGNKAKLLNIGYASANKPSINAAKPTIIQLNTKFLTFIFNLLL